jgi:biotin transport system substrate-specific component
VTSAALPLRPVLADLVPTAVFRGARTRDLALVSGAALLTALLAQVVVPVPGSPVPITGQTLAVVLTAAFLGPLRGLAGQALYLALGAVGLPFYAEASGGFEVVTGATGGYLVGFLPAAFLIGLAARYRADRDLLRAVPLFVAGQAVVFAIGVPWLAVTVGLTADEALAAGFYPFIAGGLVKALVAAGVMTGAWRTAEHRLPARTAAGLVAAVALASAAVLGVDALL